MSEDRVSIAASSGERGAQAGPERTVDTVTTERVIVAGVGNVFLSDDGFGVEVARRLGERTLPDGVEVVDVGLRSRDLAYRLLDGYRALVLVDATQRGGPPGTVYTLEHDLDEAAQTMGEAAAPVGHETDANAVLALLTGMAAAMGVPPPVKRVIVVGCEPAALDEGVGLSPPVAAAVDLAAETVAEIATELLAEERSTHVPGYPR